MYEGRQRTVSQFGASQAPFISGSIAGSDHGSMIQLQLPPLGYQHSGSGYGFVADPRTTMMSNMNLLASSTHSSGFGLVPNPGDIRPTSSFSMATSLNALAQPNANPNPTDEELYNALRVYLSTQDLMTVTKK